MSVQVKELQPMGYEIVIERRPIKTGLMSCRVAAVKMLVINGDKRSVIEWAAAYGINHATVKSRVNAGKPLECLFVQVKPQKHKRLKPAENEQLKRVYADAAFANKNMMRIFIPYSSKRNKQLPYISVS